MLIRQETGFGLEFEKNGRRYLAGGPFGTFATNTSEGAKAMAEKLGGTYEVVPVKKEYPWPDRPQVSRIVRA